MRIPYRWRRIALGAMVLILIALPVLTACAPNTAGEDASASTASELALEPEPESVPVSAWSENYGCSCAAPRGPVAQARVDTPPVVVAVRPERGEEQPLDAPIVITFDQPMDQKSTVAAFAIEPAVAGDVVVEGATLTFRPREPLPRAAAFEITVAESARGVNGLTLAAPFQQRFTTVGYLEVASVQPAADATEVATDAAITVVFDRPVVPLVGLDKQATLPQPLQLEPAATGVGEWLNTSIYVFRPDPPLAAATKYTARIAAGLTDVAGGVLAEEYTWSFTTTSPTVVMRAPASNQVAPTSPITVSFSQPMDAASTEAAFSLRTAEDNVAVTGRFDWQDEGRTLVFRPDQPLAYGTGYVVTIAETARPAHGQGTLRAAERFTFRVVAKPAVRTTTPRDGDQAADPYGAVEIVFRSPIDVRTLVSGTVTVLPEPTQVYTWYNEYDYRLIISWDRQPRTAYTVTLSGQIGDAYGNTVGEDVVIRFRTRDYDPMAYINGFGQVGTYNAYTSTLIAASYRNVSRLDFRLYRVDTPTFIALTGEQQWDAWQRFRPKEADLLRQWSVEVAPPPNLIRTWSGPLTDEEGGALAPGLYLLELRAPEITYNTERGPSRQLLVVSRLNLTFKTTDHEALLWATDLRSGQPVPDLKVRVQGETDFTSEGQTDAAGVFTTTFAKREPWRPLYAFVGEPGTDTFAVAHSQWSNGISPWEFGLNSEYYQAPVNVYLYTDRPIYRPGQTVHWKAILRWDDDARYRPLEAGQTVTVTVGDGFGNMVLQEQCQVTPLGTVAGDLPLAPEAALGWYNITLQLDLPGVPESLRTQQYGVSFQVAEYRKPEYELKIATDRPQYIQGDRIQVTTQANYFFGGPVKDAEVRWSLLSDDYFFQYQGEGWYSFEDFKGWDYYRPYTYRYGEPLAQGKGKTDAEGRFTFSAPADIAARGQSQNFTFDVRVLDINGQEVAGATTAVVHKAAFYLGTAPRQYVLKAGQRGQVDFITVDPDSRHVASIPLTAVVSLAKWYSVQEKSDDGRFYWASKVEETPVVTQTLTTDAQGKAVLTWTPDVGGQYIVRARAADAQGNAVASAAFVWVSSQAEAFVPWRMESNDRIDLVADKKEYQVGDVAQVLVPSPYQGAVRALLTLERGRILSHAVITLTSNSETLAISITEEHVPNIFVSVVLVKGMDEQAPGPSFKVGYVELPVSIKEKELQITLTPSAAVVTPRAPLTYTVEARDAAGNPVEADLSLALIDKAVLSLAGPNTESIVNRFYRRRGVGVNTAATLAINLDRLVEQQAKGTKGGGGGPGGEGPSVRREFPDSVFWAPSVVTDAAGKAEVSLTLPDNLTTWRMIGVAATRDTLVGEATVDVVATKDLFVRPVTPRFFVAGDAADLGAVIQNNTKITQEVTIELAAQGMTLDGPPSQTLAVAAESAARVDWPVRIQPGAQVVVRMTATGSEPALSDAVELTLPVYRYTTPEIVGTSGEVSADAARTEVIYLPAGAQRDQGELQVILEPSLAAGMEKGLTFLEHYPYECTEQLLSRFLPNVLTERALQEAGLARPELEQKLAEQVGIGLQRLYSRQNLDGGWGWWGGDKSYPFISSYVVFGLVKAEQAGFSVDKDVLDRGLRYLEDQLKAPAQLRGYELNQQAFLVYVLAEAGENVISRAAALFEVRERMGLYGQGFLGLALGVLDAEGQRPRIDAIVSDLGSRAVRSATGAHWEEAGAVDSWTMNTDVRTTAIVIDLLARFGPREGLAPDAVRWLMTVRKAGHWETTQETTWSLIGLTDWMVASGELAADYSWRVALNDAELGRGVADRATLSQPVELRAAVAKLLVDQANRLRIERTAEAGQSGEGRLYYTTHLQYYLPVDAIKARDRGIVIARRYVLADDPKRPITQAKVGDIIQVELTIVAANDLNYLVVEDPLPAGAEAVDTSLRTTSQTFQGPQMQEVAPEGETTWWWDRWVPTHTELRDEKVALFATWLPRGTYQYTYQMRASVPGRFLTLPATAYQMYFPEVWGRSDGGAFTITR